MPIVENKVALIDVHELKDEKVLLVDDNKTNRKVFGQFLDAWKIPHKLVDSGTVAMQTMYDAMADGDDLTIVLIDLHMPEMDGEQLGAMIRNDDQFSDVRMGTINFQCFRGDAVKMHKLGFSGYLSKPVRISEFHNVLLKVSNKDGVVHSDTLVTRYNNRLPQVKFQAKVSEVDDDTINQTVSNGMLSRFGIDVDLASVGREALDLFHHHSYDLVFMDCQMPVMDGYTATKKIRDPQTRIKDHAIPVVAMTAYVMQGDRDKCLAAGMDDFIAKPVDPTKLVQILDKWLTKDCSIGADTELIEKAVVVEADEKLPVFDYLAMSERLMHDEELIRTMLRLLLPGHIK